MAVKKAVQLPKLMKKTQEVVNKWVRDRDKESGCICCGGPVQHAGHYFSQGNYSALRYNVNNIWGCCIKCNVYLHGNLAMYRIGLVERIGEEAVKELEKLAVTDRVKKWQRFELEEIINRYK